MNNRPIDIMSLLAKHIRNAASHKSSLTIRSFPYSYLQYLQIDLGDEEFEPPSIYHTINEGTIARIHYKYTNHTWVYKPPAITTTLAEPVPPTEDDRARTPVHPDQPTVTVGPSSAPPPSSLSILQDHLEHLAIDHEAIHDEL